MLNKIRLALIYIFIILFTGCNNHNSNEDAVTEIIEPVVHIPQIAYGIIIDSLDVVREKVKKNEFLSDILLRYNIDYSDIDYIARYTKDTFDVRKIVVGNNYSAIMTRDSLPQLLYFAYEITPADYVLYSFSDSVIALIGKKEIVVEKDDISGQIESSLWNSIIDANSDPNLANNLSEIYAWTIDFFGLQKGDRYKAFFERKYVDSTYIGLGKVEATVFYQGRDTLYAFYFEQNGKGDYFDEKGNSLQRTFLKAPLRYTRISSKFSNSRLHPVLKIRRPHHGVDYAAPAGTPVQTVGDGVVVKKGYQKRGGGNYITIKHNGTYSTTYMHLQGYAKGIKVGDRVRQGDVIGYVG